MNIGEIIRNRRKELQMTQRQLAEKIGYEDQNVSRWERGIILPDIYTIKSIADALEIDLYELLGYKEIKPKNEIKNVNFIFVNNLK